MTKLAIAFAIAGQSLDFTTTAYGLKNGFKETNPLLSNHTLITKAVVSTLGIYAIHRVAPSHPKLARSLAFVVGASGTTAGIINVRRIGEK